jgi:ATP-dependent RNA helicase DeaD
MPPEIRKLSEKYLYNPEHVKVRAKTLTVDTVEQFGLEVPQREKADALGTVMEAERPDQAIVFVRTKIRCDQLYRTLRDRGMNVKALHGDMSQGSRDGVMLAFKSGRLPILVATDVAARGLDISSVTHVVNFDVPTSPDVYVHRIGRTGRVGRSGRAITFYEPKQKRDIEAIERHTSTPMAPWTPGAHVAALSVEVKPKRHERKPHDVAKTNGDRAAAEGARTRLVIAGGLAHGIEPKDLIHAITSAAGIDGESVRNIRVLERFAFLDVPAHDAERVIEQVDGTDVDGHTLRLEPIKG